MGGLIATTQDKLQHVSFCVCNDRFDTKFISIAYSWYNGTFRVVSRTFIYDCAAAGRLDVDKDFEIVPTWTIHEWIGAILPRKPKRKVQPEPIAEVEVTARPPRHFSGGTGLLTPAPSFDRDGPKKARLFIFLPITRLSVNIRGRGLTLEITLHISLTPPAGPATKKKAVGGWCEKCEPRVWVEALQSHNRQVHFRKAAVLYPDGVELDLVRVILAKFCKKGANRNEDV
ncbi:hypothetical protein B0H13DRAFT_1882129 [Mycena leptocephala]|nr:hypothetical protein B0H13DRAFT_1882129 [Mycena leptocephala]